MRSSRRRQAKTRQEDWRTLPGLEGEYRWSQSKNAWVSRTGAIVSPELLHRARQTNQAKSTEDDDEDEDSGDSEDDESTDEDVANSGEQAPEDDDETQSNSNRYRQLPIWSGTALTDLIRRPDLVEGASSSSQRALSTSMATMTISPNAAGVRNYMVRDRSQGVSTHWQIGPPQRVSESTSVVRKRVLGNHGNADDGEEQGQDVASSRGT
jgi:hypothetical protein